MIFTRSITPLHGDQRQDAALRRAGPAFLRGNSELLQPVRFAQARTFDVGYQEGKQTTEPAGERVHTY